LSWQPILVGFIHRNGSLDAGASGTAGQADVGSCLASSCKTVVVTDMLGHIWDNITTSSANYQPASNMLIHEVGWLE